MMAARLALVAALALACAATIAAQDTSVGATTFKEFAEIARDVPESEITLTVKKDAGEGMMLTNHTNFPGSEMMAHFLVLGDIGRTGSEKSFDLPQCSTEDFGLKDDHILGGFQQQQTAFQADHLCQVIAGGCKFVLNTGDNFYECGVYPGDNGRLYETWFDIYKDSKKTPGIANATWYSTIGNHDIVIDGSVEQQISFMEVEADWRFPDYNFFEDIDLGNNASLRIISLDTNAFVSFYNRPESKYYTGYMEDYGNEKYIQSVLDLAESAMSSSTATWTVLMSHYPLFGTGFVGGYNSSRDFPGEYNGFSRLVELINIYKPVAYFNGHTHTLTLGNSSYLGPDMPNPNDHTFYVTTGAAGWGEPADSCAPSNMFVYSNGGNPGFNMASANSTHFIVQYYTAGSLFSQCTVTSTVDGAPFTISEDCKLTISSSCCYLDEDSPEYCG